MRTLLRGTFVVFVAGAVVGGATTSALMFTSGEIARCKTGDFGTLSPAEPSTSDYPWIHRARRCDIGAYSVVTPASGDETGIVIHQRGNAQRTVVAADHKGVALFDPGGKRGLRGLVVLSAGDGDTATIFNVGGSGKQLVVERQTINVVDVSKKRVLLSADVTEADGIGFKYSAHDPTQHAWVETFVGRDGDPYLRTTEIEGRPTKIEVQHGGQWEMRHAER